MSAIVIAFEGADRVGKATQCEMLVHRLREQGSRVVSMSMPMYGTRTGRLISLMLRSGSAQAHSWLFQLVHLANKLGFMQACLPYLRAEFDYVVLDRWTPSAQVYGEVTGLPRWLCWLTSLGTRAVDCVVVLDGPTKRDVDEGDSYERDLELQARVRLGYRRWAEERFDTAVLVDAIGTRGIVHSRIVQKLTEKGLIN